MLSSLATMKIDNQSINQQINNDDYFSDVDECRRPDACGLGAICTNTLGSYTCTCPPGSMPEPDAYTECLEIMKCDSIDDCPGNALCIEHHCMCPEPNIGDDCRRKLFFLCFVFVQRCYLYYYLVINLNCYLVIGILL